jgi:hypothetical protein
VARLTSRGLNPGDVSDIKSKTRPYVMTHLDDFFQRLPQRHTDAGTSERSWWVDRKTIEERNFDLKAVNPTRTADQDSRTPSKLLYVIEAKGTEVTTAAQRLRQLLAQ